ncbi:MAG: PIN domain-containing protein [Nitriliruptorales bacterium]|nr:PIN domain-containing protein [Nitriliruptorales bacterium]
MRFVDTSFLVALFFEGDSNHVPAKKLWQGRAGALLCSNHVIGETWTFLRRHRGHRHALRVIDAVTTSPSLTVVRLEQAAEDEAWEWLRRHDEREYSFVDATSFAVMRRRRLREALAFDGDFAAAGFVEARPD